MIVNGMRIKVVNKVRFTLFLICFFLFLLSIFMLGFNRVTGSEYADFEYYVVDKGDTLWKIADSVSDSQVDVREVLYDIKVLNDIGDSEYIYPGQSIKVPVLR